MGGWKPGGIVSLLAALLVLVQTTPLIADQIGRINESGNVLREIMAISEKAIPPLLVQNAYAVAVFPGLLETGFSGGGRRGKGVLAVNQGGRWSNPIFVDMSAGAAVAQIGAESTDLILIFKTPHGVDAVRNGKFTLGDDLSVAAGPVGRHAEAETGIQLKAEIYSYSRSRGFWDGVAVEGVMLRVDNEANAAVYGKNGASVDGVLAGRTKSPPAAAKFRLLLQKYSNPKGR